MAEDAKSEEFRKTTDSESGVGRGQIHCECFFYNQTGREIDLETLTHTIDKNKTILAEKKKVAVGESIKCKNVLSYSGVPVHDYWFVKIKMAGKTYSNDSFYCDLTSGDNKGVLSLRVDKSHFYTDMPVSSSCKKSLK